MRQLIAMLAAVMVAAILLAGWFLYRNTQLEAEIKTRDQTITALSIQISALTTEGVLPAATPVP
jgi:hypothetical protein